MWQDHKSMVAGLLALSLAASACGTASPTEGQRVTSSEPDLPPNGAECDGADPAWIWCDDFEQDRLTSYFEVDRAGGSLAREGGAGLDGSVGIAARWAEGQVDAGSLHLGIGRSPDAYRASVGPAEDLREVYWRFYVRNQEGWTGGGGKKLTRAFAFHSPDNWGQAMIAHLWSGGANDEYLVLDPASGTDPAGEVQTSRYNDFDNLRWLGITPGSTPIFRSGNTGVWYCVEAQVRLNDPGMENGVFRYWIDRSLEAERSDLNWVGAYQDYGINAVFLENFWNDGSPTRQARYFDNFVVSTERIGCR